jgi:hypothetical protein
MTADDGPRRASKTTATMPNATTGGGDDGDGDDDDDAENDENDERRGGNRRDRDRGGRRGGGSGRHRHRSDGDGDDAVLGEPPPLADFMINDACYRRYLLEGRRSRYRGVGGGRGNGARGGGGGEGGGGGGGGFMDPSFLANVCAGYSFVGMVFLIFVAIIMETQPLFLRGVSVRSHSSSSSSSSSGIGDDDSTRGGFRRETSNALKASAAYFLAMVVSLVYLQVRDANLELECPAVFGRACHARRLVASAYFRYRRRHYEDIPDGDDGDGDDRRRHRRRRRRSEGDDASSSSPSY